jgi:hypothetical protein
MGGVLLAGRRVTCGTVGVPQSRVRAAVPSQGRHPAADRGVSTHASRVTRTPPAHTHNPHTHTSTRDLSLTPSLTKKTRVVVVNRGGAGVCCTVQLEHSGHSHVREQAARLLGHLIKVSQRLISPYVSPILRTLLPKLRDSHPGESPVVFPSLAYSPTLSPTHSLTLLHTYSLITHTPSIVHACVE